MAIVTTLSIPLLLKRSLGPGGHTRASIPPPAPARRCLLANVLSQRRGGVSSVQQPSRRGAPTMRGAGFEDAVSKFARSCGALMTGRTSGHSGRCLTNARRLRHGADREATKEGNENACASGGDRRRYRRVQGALSPDAPGLNRCHPPRARRADSWLHLARRWQLPELLDLVEHHNAGQFRPSPSVGEYRTAQARLRSLLRAAWRRRGLTSAARSSEWRGPDHRRIARS
jgi:hypothetical protein